MSRTSAEPVSYRLSSAVRDALDREVERRKSAGDRIRVGEAVEEAIWGWLRGEPGYLRRNKQSHEILEALLNSKRRGLRDLVLGALLVMSQLASAEDGPVDLASDAEVQSSSKH